MALGETGLVLINVVNQHWAWLVLGWVTISRLVNQLLLTCLLGLRRGVFTCVECQDLYSACHYKNNP